MTKLWFYGATGGGKAWSGVSSDGGSWEYAVSRTVSGAVCWVCCMQSLRAKRLPVSGDNDEDGDDDDEARGSRWKWKALAGFPLH